MAEYFSQGMKRFNYLTSELDHTYHEIARELHLSDSAMTVLYTICNFGDHCLLSDICKLSGVSKQTINSAVRKLESEGMIYLEARQGRRKTVYLTEAGKRLVQRTVARLIEAENEAFDAWTEEEQSLYLKLTERFLITLRKKMKEL